MSGKLNRSHRFLCPSHRIGSVLNSLRTILSYIYIPVRYIYQKYIPGRVYISFSYTTIYEFWYYMRGKHIPSQAPGNNTSLRFSTILLFTPILDYQLVALTSIIRQATVAVLSVLLGC